MDTRLKQTPLPIPSLAFLTKNFNDGTHETDNNAKMTHRFGSLGLKNYLEAEPIDQSLALRLNEKHQQIVRIFIFYLISIIITCS